jgi:hypothetical protein
MTIQQKLELSKELQSRPDIKEYVKEMAWTSIRAYRRMSPEEQEMVDKDLIDAAVDSAMSLTTQAEVDNFKREVITKNLNQN